MNPAALRSPDLKGTAAEHPLAAFLRNTIADPQRTAIIASGRSTTYAELLENVLTCASGLRSRRMQIGDLAALPAIRSERTIALLLALLHEGSAYLPLDPGLPQLRLDQMLADAQPRWLIRDVDREKPVLPASDVGDSGIRHCSIDELFARRASVSTRPPNCHAPEDLRQGETAYVLFTSGSTGRPKGVAMGTAPLQHLIDWHGRHPRLGLPARTLQFAPLSFDVSFQEIFSTLGSGGTLVLPTDSERRDPWALVDLIEQERIERIFLPCVALQALAAAGAPALRKLISLRDVVTAGEQLRITSVLRDMFEALPECVLHNHYGPTEAHVVSACELSGEPAGWPNLPSIGRPLPHVKIDIVGDDLQPASPGSEGEILIGGPCLAQRYIGRPDLTDQRFVMRAGARFYRTGDRGRVDANGELVFLGRLDDQIKIAGFRIEPVEIEMVLQQHPGIAEAVVVAEESPIRKRLVAHVVPHDLHIAESTLGNQLRMHCESRLAHYLVPEAYVVHQILPATSSGKIDRRALGKGAARETVLWDASMPLQEQLIRLWRQLLDVRELDPNANLFDQGARSLLVVHALTELRRQGHVLSVAQIYEHPSVAAQARLLGGYALPSEKPAAAQRGERQREAFAGFGQRRSR